jgi:carboxyl-terminal processing protease
MTSLSRIRLFVAAVALLVAGAAAPRTLPAQTPPMASDVKSYLRQFVGKLREVRVNRDELDWGQVEARTLAAAAGAQTLTDAYPAVRTALIEIRDPWAMYRSATGQVVGPDQPRCVRSVATTPTVPADVGYLKGTPLPSRGVRADREAALAVRSALKAGDENGAVHWIIDLRGYFMGTLPPAVIGLSPIMGDGTIFKMQYANTVVPFNAGESSIKANGEELQLALGPHKLTNKKRRIALLVDGGTAGVGELLTIAFMGRSDARVFGTPTCGIPPMRLVPQKLKDGAEFTLTAFLVQDRDGRVYRGPVEPNERIEDEAQLFSRVLAWVSTGR